MGSSFKLRFDRVATARRSDTWDYVVMNSARASAREDKYRVDFRVQRSIAPLQGAEIFSFVIQGWRDLRSLTPG